LDRIFKRLPRQIRTYRPEAQPAATVAANGAAGASQVFAAAQHATPMWWTQFQSDGLNRLVEQPMQQVSRSRRPARNSSRLAKTTTRNLALANSHLPDTLPLTLPSTLARERPDIRASEALLHQASANVGVATASLYPQFALSAGIGSERTNTQELVSGLNIWNFGLNLTQPIFRGGELRAKKRSAQAAYVRRSPIISKRCCRRSNRWRIR
jgi:outer membrane protein TolC